MTKANEPSEAIRSEVEAVCSAIAIRQSKTKPGEWYEQGFRETVKTWAEVAEVIDASATIEYVVHVYQNKHGNGYVVYAKVPENGEEYSVAVNTGREAWMGRPWTKSTVETE